MTVTAIPSHTQMQKPLAAEEERVAVVHLPVQTAFFPTQKIFRTINVVYCETIWPAAV